MRDAFARAVAAQGADPHCAFLTGDLGFMALEPVREAFGERFVNVGVAEQNLMGVAAGLASEGMRVYAYSIAPFASLRALEQIKLDIAGQGLSVCIVGNGGGYGYGHMGPTHHALEDLAVLSSVGVRCLVPAFDADVTRFIDDWEGPTYLRLGRQEGTAPTRSDVGGDESASAGLRVLLAGTDGHLVALGPLAGLALAAFDNVPESSRPNVWSCTSLPLAGLPAPLAALPSGQRVVAVEEHRGVGGLGQQLAAAFVAAGRQPDYVHVAAAGYPSGQYGSQAFHREESGLDAAAMRRHWGL